MNVEKLKLKKHKPIYTRTSKPLITLSQVGIRFNKGCQTHMNKHYKYCELYYDRDAKVIGIHPTNEFSEYSRKIVRNNDIYPIICAVDFLRDIGIITKLKSKNCKSIRTIPVWSDKKKMFLVDLNL